MEEIPYKTPGLNTGQPGAVQTRDAAAGVERVFAANFREMRTAKGLTQKAVAETMSLLGFSMMHTTIAKIESGERPVRLNEAFGLASCVGVNIFQLLGIVDSAQQIKAMNAIRAANDMQSRHVKTVKFVREAERRHRRELRTYLTDRLAELGPDEGE